VAAAVALVDVVAVAVVSNAMKDHPPRLSKPVTCRVIAKANWCAVGRWPTRCPISMRVCTCKTSKKSEKWMKFWAKLMRFTSPSNWNLACKVKVFNPRIKFLLEQTNYCLLRGSQTPELLAVVVEVDAVVEEVAAVVDGEALEDEEDPAAAEDLADEEEDVDLLGAGEVVVALVALVAAVEEEAADEAGVDFRLTLKIFSIQQKRKCYKMITAPPAA